MSRPVGVPNNNPSKASLQRDLAERGISFFQTYWDMVNDPLTSPDLKAKMLMHLMEFVYPKRRPEDSDGAPEEARAIVYSTEALAELIKAAREK